MVMVIRFNKNSIDKEMFFFLAFFCINVCDFIKNIYWIFILGIIMLIIGECRIQNRVDTNRFWYTLVLLAFASFSIWNNSAYSSNSTNILKFLVYIIIAILLSGKTGLSKKCIKYAAFWGYIHVIATWFFFAFPSFYPPYAMSVYGVFPVGTEYGVKGYTAALCSHYSANALYLTGCVIALIALLIDDKKNKKLWCILLIAIGALLLSNKRSHVLFLLLSLYIILCIVYRGKLKKLLDRTIKILIAGFIGAGIFSLIMPSLFNVLSRISDGTSGRNVYWLKAIEWYLQKPVLGIGWLQFGKRYAEFNWGNPMNVHNVYLQVLCENGIVGFIIFLVMIIYPLYKTVRIYTLGKAEMDCFLFYSLCAQLFFLLYCFTGNCIYDNTLFYYAIAIGLGLGLHTYYGGEHPCQD